MGAFEDYLRANKPANLLNEGWSESNKITNLTKPNTDTIIKQLGGNRFFVMTGAKVKYLDGNWLVFALKGTTWNMMRIGLQSDDLYTMMFEKWPSTNAMAKADKWEPKKFVVHTDVYWDKLQEIFTKETGMYTHL